MVWTEEEEKVVMDLANRLKDREVAAIISGMRGAPVSADAVMQKRRALGIRKAKGRGVCKVIGRSPTPPDGA